MGYEDEFSFEILGHINPDRQTEFKLGSNLK
jgi:hypothetical protein